MDSEGAVSLTLPALVTKVIEPEKSALRVVGDAAARQWDVNPYQWAVEQTARLVLASVLEARLLHVRNHRLGAFSLVKDPDGVTVEQLAALARGHSGTAGQAFELAVADACNAGHPDVVEPLREALKLVVGQHVDAAPKMTVLGMEKIPAASRASAAERLLELLPGDGSLRTGRPGRPLGAEGAVRRLTSSTWSSMSGADAANASQLARADAILTAGRHITAVSMKVNPKSLLRNHRGWRDVPIWITTTPWETSSVTASTRSAEPMVVVRLAGRSKFHAAFVRALSALDSALQCIDRGSLGSEDPLVNGLVTRRTHTVAEVAAELRRVSPEVQEAYGHRVWTRSSRQSVLAADLDLITAAWRADAKVGNLLLGQKHLFFGQDLEGEAAS